MTPFESKNDFKSSFFFYNLIEPYPFVFLWEIVFQKIWTMNQKNIYVYSFYERQSAELIFLEFFFFFFFFSWSWNMGLKQVCIFTSDSNTSKKKLVEAIRSSCFFTYAGLSWIYIQIYLHLDSWFGTTYLGGWRVKQNTEIYFPCN